MNVVVIKYNAGNIRSVLFALERIGVNATVSDEYEVICKADKIIFPGVGEAGSAMKYLKEKGLDKTIHSLKQPVLGICIGLQLLCSYSEEGNTTCIGVFNQQIKKFSPDSNLRNDIVYKIPQIGWNTIYDLKSSLFKGVPGNSFMYFVNSYYAEQGENTIATADYIIPFSAALHKDNFYAVQFHTEKSGDIGQIILQNFLSI